MFTKDEVINKAVSIFNNCKNNFNLHENVNCEFSFYYSGTSAGHCKTLGNNSYEIAFNYALFERMSDYDVIDTIKHEIAHLIVSEIYPNKKQAHGKEFRYVCRIIGCTGRTYHTVDVTGLRKRAIKRHIYNCECGNIYNLTTTVHNRIQNETVGYRCNTCYIRISKTFFSGKVKIMN